MRANSSRRKIKQVRKGAIMAVLRKVGIIGIGHVGAHVANAVLSAGLAEELKQMFVDR